MEIYFVWAHRVLNRPKRRFRSVPARAAYNGTVAPNGSSLGALMWRVELPPTPASAAPETVTVTAAWRPNSSSDALSSVGWAGETGR